MQYLALCYNIAHSAKLWARGAPKLVIRVRSEMLFLDL